MSKLNITEGEWFKSGLEVVAMPSQVKISNSISGSNYDEAKANATLICDAANTYQKKPILPSKLLEDRYTMIELIRVLKGRLEEDGINCLARDEANRLLKEVEDDNN